MNAKDNICIVRFLKAFAAATILPAPGGLACLSDFSKPLPLMLVAATIGNVLALINCGWGVLQKDLKTEPGFLSANVNWGHRKDTTKNMVAILCF